jgi:hypothetical protein
VTFRREGLPNALAKKKFETMEKGVSDTVGHYLAGIARLEEQHKIKVSFSLFFFPRPLFAPSLDALHARVDFFPLTLP